VVNFTNVITALHEGRVSYRICRFTDVSDAGERAALTESCLDQNQLVQAAGSQTPGSPYFYLGDATGSQTFQMRYVPPMFFSRNEVSAFCVFLPSDVGAFCVPLPGGYTYNTEAYACALARVTRLSNCFHALLMPKHLFQRLAASGA
jgi:hypothetical protein